MARHRDKVENSMDRRKAGLLIAGGALGSLGILAIPYLGSSGVRIDGFPTLPVFDEAAAQIVPANVKVATELARTYNIKVKVHPELRILCRTADAVSTLVQWAREHDIPFAIRSGGHCFAGHSQHKRLVIDLREMQNIEINRQRQMVSVGAGQQIGPLHRLLAKAGFGIPAGVCPGVAIGGHVLGGGIGYTSRQSGLLCDQLQSLELVNAQGQLVLASNEQNDDLFWASRGGGGNLGIATRFSFSLRKRTRLSAIGIHRRLSTKDTAQLLADWQEWSQRQPFGTTTHIKITKYPTGGMLVSFTGQSTEPRDLLIAAMSGIFAGSVPDFERDITTGSPIEALAKEPEGRNLPDVYEFVQHDLLRQALNFDKCLALLEILEAHIVNGAYLFFEPLDGAVNDVTADATAFPHRGEAAFIVQCSTTIDNIFQREERLAGVLAVKAFMQPFSTGGAYVNYPDADLENPAQAYWGDNLPRLSAIKRKYDPDNLFRHRQGIPLDG